jgi:hypothetical protein
MQRSQKLENAVVTVGDMHLKPFTDRMKVMLCDQKEGKEIYLIYCHTEGMLRMNKHPTYKYTKLGRFII